MDYNLKAVITELERRKKANRKSIELNSQSHDLRREMDDSDAHWDSIIALVKSGVCENVSYEEYKEETNETTKSNKNIS